MTSLIVVSDHRYSNIEDRKANLCIFLDLKKPFDTVDHEILISNLLKYGVESKENNWIKSYLGSRSQYCSIDGHTDGHVSDTLEIKYGIPQGSYLGPLLVMVYLNDFEHCLKHSKANTYADETRSQYH